MVGREGTGGYAGVEDIGEVGSLDKNCHGVGEVRFLKLESWRPSLIRQVPPLQRPVQ